MKVHKLRRIGWKTELLGSYANTLAGKEVGQPDKICAFVLQPASYCSKAPMS
jgi:hypothetical protein